MYLTGNYSNFGNRLHQLPRSGLDLTTFQLEGSGYYGNWTANQRRKYSDEVRKKYFSILDTVLTGHFFTTSGVSISYLPVNYYLNMDFASSGPVTSGFLQNSAFGNITSDPWVITSGASGSTIVLGTEGEGRLFGGISINGTGFTDTGVNALRFQNGQLNTIRLPFTPTYDRVSLGCFMTFGSNDEGGGNFASIDQIEMDMQNGQFGVLQLRTNGQVLSAHSNVGVSGSIPIVTGRAYWVTCLAASGDKFYARVYDTGTMLQSGLELSITIGGLPSQIRVIRLGRCDSHGGPALTSVTAIDDLIISTTGLFPLLPT